ncbi:Facilitated trehalose transporter Tret1 [Eumeta japonica]|uniref:Facilitated trehalose transporter Tret1 n=1 Tax=Eumeta variegata TaxID=151549 RepID=A0A4C1VLC1_EUMVA|nr:Facilitated trehalose transporter Tret1 [Eumeta japonica]
MFAKARQGSPAWPPARPLSTGRPGNGRVNADRIAFKNANRKFIHILNELLQYGFFGLDHFLFEEKNECRRSKRMRQKSGNATAAPFTLATRRPALQGLAAGDVVPIFSCSGAYGLCSLFMRGGEQSRHAPGDEERLYRSRGPKYARVPSRPTLSASTTCTSLATSCGSQGTLAPNYATIPEHVSTETSSEDEDDFEKTRRHFQQLCQISLGSEFKYKMEMEIQSAKQENQKNSNLKNSIPFVKQLSIDSNKVKTDYSINNEVTPRPEKLRLSRLITQVFAAIAVSMGSLIVGFSSGYTSPALPSMNVTFAVTTEQETWVGGLMPLSALVGGAIGGPLIEYFGRRRTIAAIAVPFFIGWMLIANASNIFVVMAGRAFSGFCVGIGSLAFPVYLGEVLQSEVRGALGLLPTAFGNIGILLAFLAGAYLNWSQLAFLGAALPIPFFLLMLGTPETPRWYVTHGRVNDAKRSLQWLRGSKTNVERELEDLTRTQAEADYLGGSGISQLFDFKYRRAVLIALGLMLFQQLSGINAVVFYASKIFKMSGSNIDKDLCSIILGIVNFISTFIATALIDRLGRKILLYISSVTMILTLVTLGAYLYVLKIGMDVAAFGWIPLLSLVLYVLGFSIGFGPIPWLMMGEILPARIRGNAAAIATGFNWTCTFIVTKTFQNIVDAINLYGTVWLFSAICLIGLLFVILCVPETRGISLEEIEKKLTGGSRRPRNINKRKKNVQKNSC